MLTNIVIFNSVSLFGKSIQHVFRFCGGLTGLALLSAYLGACSDIPDLPDSSSKIQDFEVYVHQADENLFDPLKINSNDSATLVVHVTPDTYQDKVRYYWYNGEDVLDSGNSYPVSTTMTASPFTVQNFIPDRVEIIDNEGNRLEKQISVIVNAPPEISKVTTPANGDTLYGNSHTPFLFAWYAWDRDDDDIIYSIIEIDGKSYSLGDLDNIRQSGLDEGEHTFRIIVEDSRGDRDSIPSRTFFVLDTLEGK